MNRMSKIYYFIRIYTQLVYFDIKLRKRGFHNIFYKYIEKYACTDINEVLVSGGSKAKIKIFEDRVNDFISLIDCACAFYPLKADCMHRSFLGYKFLRQNLSLPVDLVIGVTKFPFSAHAWLKLGADNINELEENTRQYNVILYSGRREGIN